MPKVEEETKSVLFSIMLLENDCSIDEPEFYIKGYQSLNVIEKGDDYFLYRRRGSNDIPKWLRDFDEKVWNEPIKQHFLNTASEGLSVIKKINYNDEDYLFAINFGQGRHNIIPNKVEDTFGIYTAIKMIIDGAEIKGASSRNLSSNPKNTQLQYGKEASKDELYIELEYNDVIRQLNASADTDEIGSVIGKYGPLNIRMKFKESEIPCWNHLENRLIELIEKFNSILDSDEKDNFFKGLQSLPRRRQEELFNELPNKLLDESSHFYLFEPEIDFDYTLISGFKYKLSCSPTNNEEFYELNLTDYLHLRENPSLEELKYDEVILLNEDGYIYKKWNISKCLYGEMVSNGKIYILSHGIWYDVPQEKFERINRNIQEITDLTFTVNESVKINISNQIKEFKMSNPWAKIPKERIFNKNLCSTLNGEFFDEINKQIIIEGDKMEICDIFLPREKEFIHSKIDINASKLSHLFTQGYASGRAFASLKEIYIPLVNDKINNTENKLTGAPQEHLGYVVRYLIINTKTKNELTFISKLALDDKITTLKGFGFDVKLSWVNNINLNPQIETV